MANAGGNAKRRVVRWIMGASAIFLIVSSSSFASWLNGSPTGSVSSRIINSIKENLLNHGKRRGDSLNILLIGKDSRGGESGRSDTLVLMRLDFKRERVYFLSIPRDMRVNVPGHGLDKINSAYAYGQASLTVRTVEDFLGVDLDHYIEVDFNSFKQLVDALGGIDITVDEAISDRNPQFRMNIPKGRQRMDGDTALNYVRYRHGDSDFGRVERQQNFLRALALNTIKFRSIFRLPKLVRVIDQNVVTDMSRRKMLATGQFMGRVKKKKIETLTLPGRMTNIEGISYVEPDHQVISRIIKTVEAGDPLAKMNLSQESDRIRVAKQTAAR